MGRDFGGDARRLADVIRLLIVRDEGLRPRSLFYLPPDAPGGFGVVVLPVAADAERANGMIAVAAGLHLSGERYYSLYEDGTLVGPTRHRHRRASVFAQCFLRGRSTAERHAG